MKIISDRSIQFQQFKHFKKLINHAVDKNIAFGNITDNLDEYIVKYPFVDKISTVFLSENDYNHKLNCTAKELNNYFIELYKEKRKDAIKEKKNFEKEIVPIFSAINKIKNDNLNTLEHEVKDLSLTVYTSFNKNKEFNKLITSLKKCDFYDAKKRTLNTRGYNITENRKNITLRQGYYILLVIWMEEILMDYKFHTNLDGEYLVLFNNYFHFEEKGKKLTKHNWATFKASYVSNLKINELKNTDFYILILKNIEKTYGKVK